MLSRKQAEKRGRRSEMAAALFLILKGYRILGRRVRTPLGEIDLIARSLSGVLCFIEVKARKSGGEALLSVGPRQQSRIARAAALYLARHPGLADKGSRYDIMLVEPGRWPRHLRDAWRGDGA
jgi:putative endonuclease